MTADPSLTPAATTELDRLNPDTASFEQVWDAAVALAARLEAAEAECNLLRTQRDAYIARLGEAERQIKGKDKLLRRWLPQRTGGAE